ncbi:MAG: hypothetical protein ABIB97_02625 [Patescibacteria group bacterium]
MPKIRNRFLAAFLKLILFTGVIHIAILIAYSIKSVDKSQLHLFRILDLDLFWPEAFEGLTSFIVSVAVIIILYLIIYFFFTERKK